MSNFVKVIKMCESAEGAGTKKTIQAALATLDPIAHRLVGEALNPYRVFGVRKYDPPQVYSKTMDSQQPFEDFFALLDMLAAGSLTGNAAREAVTATLQKFNQEWQAYLARILDKDLRAGFSVDTVNKVCGSTHGIIPTFEVMLADKCEEVEDFEKSVTFPCQADFKYDGERTIAMVRATGVTYYSRSGKEADHLNGIFDDELMEIRASIGYDYILDGERFASNFTETVNAKKSGNDEAKKNLRFRAFFMMPLTDWIAQKTSITMRQNRVELERRLLLSGCKKILLSEGREVKDYHDMMEYCNEVIDKHGQEGLILKDWDSTYQWDRTMAWCKVKRFYPADARIIGFYKGRVKSRLANTIGGAVVAGWTEDGVYFETCVGSGFSDELRAAIMANPKKYIGLTAVIKYQEVSRAKTKKHASLRFPTLEHIRDDKIVEMADDAELVFPGRHLI